MWERKELKKKGLAAFRANYWRCVLVGVLLSLFVAGASASTGRTAKNGARGENGSGTTSIISDEEGNTVVVDKASGEIKAVISKYEILSAL